MTDEELQAISERLHRATAGTSWTSAERALTVDEDEFVKHASADVRSLLNEVHRLRRELRETPKAG